jgi:septal ring factor EnvC (AmiA/AmiB activator)
MNHPTPPPDKPQGAETPRCDSQVLLPDQVRGLPTVPFTFACRLERELNAATEALEKAKAELADSRDEIAGLGVKLCHARDGLTAEREQSRKREAALREALMNARLRFEYLFCRLGEGEINGVRISSAIGEINAALSQQAPTNDHQPI